MGDRNSAEVKGSENKGQHRMNNEDSHETKEENKFNDIFFLIFKNKI